MSLFKCCNSPLTSPTIRYKLKLDALSYTLMCYQSSNKSPAFIPNVARSCTSPRVANQIRDTLVHSFSCKQSLLH